LLLSLFLSSMSVCFCCCLYFLLLCCVVLLPPWTLWWCTIFCRLWLFIKLKKLLNCTSCCIKLSYNNLLKDRVMWHRIQIRRVGCQSMCQLYMIITFCEIVLFKINYSVKKLMYFLLDKMVGIKLLKKMSFYNNRTNLTCLD